VAVHYTDTKAMGGIVAEAHRSSQTAHLRGPPSRA
jgi:hypothetical protein